MEKTVFPRDKNENFWQLTLASNLENISSHYVISATTCLGEISGGPKPHRNPCAVLFLPCLSLCDCPSGTLTMSLQHVLRSAISFTHGMSDTSWKS